MIIAPMSHAMCVVKDVRTRLFATAQQTSRAIAVLVAAPTEDAERSSDPLDKRRIRMSPLIAFHVQDPQGRPLAGAHGLRVELTIWQDTDQTPDRMAIINRIAFLKSEVSEFFRKTGAGADLNRGPADYESAWARNPP
jgi:hypothetical protein